jgi:plastocyanin
MKKINEEDWEMLKKSKINLSVLMLGLLGLVITACSFAGDAGAMASQMSDMKMPVSRMTNENATANADEVVIQNFTFQPATLTVKVGTKVTWINRDDEPHTATDTEKRFGSKALDTGDRFSTEFTKPGTYNYYCALHPKMTGQIIVK